MSVAKREELDSSGSAVKPRRLLTMTWMEPPTLYPWRLARLRVSARMPWPAKAASPWMMMGKHLLLAVGADAGLPGARASDGDGVDGFQMAGVGDEVEMDGAAIGGVVLAGGADVVFDVAAAEDAARVDIFKFREDLGRQAADGVGHDVETPAVAHAEDGAGDSVGGAGVEHLIEKGDEDGEAFEREALGAEVAGLDDLLEEVGADELREDAGLFLGPGRGGPAPFAVGATDGARGR